LNSIFNSYINLIIDKLIIIINSVVQSSSLSCVIWQHGTCSTIGILFMITDKCNVIHMTYHGIVLQ